MKFDGVLESPYDPNGLGESGPSTPKVMFNQVWLWKFHDDQYIHLQLLI